MIKITIKIMSMMEKGRASLEDVNGYETSLQLDTQRIQPDEWKSS